MTYFIVASCPWMGTKATVCRVHADAARRERLRHLELELALGELEHGVLLARVLEVLELNHTELGEALPQPTLVGVEQAQLAAVRDDLGEDHLLEEGALGSALHELDRLLDR